MRTLILALALAVTGCTEGAPFSTALSNGPVALHKQVRLVIVAHDDPLVDRLAETASRDPKASAAGIRVEPDRWHHRGTDHHSMTLVSESRAGLASWLGEAIATDEQLRIPEGFELVYQREVGPDGSERWKTYLVDGSREMRLDSVKSITTKKGDYPQLMVELRPTDAERFATLTGDNVGRKMAILAGDRVESAPVIHEKIAGGRMAITTNPAPGQTPVDALASLRRELTGQ